MIQSRVRQRRAKQAAEDLKNAKEKLEKEE